MPQETSLLTTHKDSFVHLHLHTQYSLLDGAIRVADLIERAVELGVPAIAQTDHGNMFGAIDFYTRCKRAGIKPILGSEIYFTPGSRFERRPLRKGRSVSSQDAEESSRQIHHLILLCKNETGYHNLCQLLSCAYLEGFYYKPRADLELLRRHREGLVCTTACLKGEVGYNFFMGQGERAVKAIGHLSEIFGEDFYLEIQENGIPEQAIANEKIIAYAKEQGLQVVATNDAHYMTPEDAKAQEVLLCVQTGKTYADENRMRMTSQEFYFKTPEQMREKFAYMPEACDNTLRIADKCNLELNWKDEQGNQIYHLPDFPIPEGELLEEHFARLAREGLERRFAGPHFKKMITDEDWKKRVRPSYEERLEEEVAMISRMGFAGYFLIVADFIGWALEHDIPVGPGRGSGAGSLVAYALNITNIDPLPYNLLFERFINPERVSLPDFDVDFCQNGRAQVIDYVTEKYGKDNVGQIITFGKLQAKAVIKDVSRVFGLSFGQADTISKLIPDELGITLEKALQKEPKLTELIKDDPKVRQIFSISRRLEGLYRHAGIHAAGVIITNRPLVDYCPLFKGAKGEKVVQFDKDFCEQIGLVKFDFLGLKTLTAIKHACELIRRDERPDFDIEEIDLEDPLVYEFISQGKTIGVFQLESSGMIDLCQRIRPDCLDDITAINALYRPGPLESGMVDDFVDIKHGRKKAEYFFPELESVLKDTYGVIVYQEQVMNIARIIAGYGLGQADMLRRAMGKKKADEMARHRQIFLDGAKEKGFDLRKAQEIYELMAKFAAYGFNKSHAVAYALIAFQTAFLKKHYPPQFYASLLSVELSNIDKVTQYINDARSAGVEVLPPDINESLWRFNVVSSRVRFGLGAIKTVGEGAVQAIVKEREAGGPFAGFINFCERMELKLVGKRMLESLIKVGVFDQCEKMNRKTLLEHLEAIYAWALKRREEKELGQVSLFAAEESDFGMTRERLEIGDLDDFGEREKLQYEADLMGVYVSGHPLDGLADIMRQLSSMEVAKVQDIPERPARVGQDARARNRGDIRELTLSGLVTSKKTVLTKKGEKMCFATLEDLSGKIEMVIFPKVFQEFEGLLDSDESLVVDGHTRLDEHPRKFFPDKFVKLAQRAEERVKEVQINVRMEELTPKKLERLKLVLLGHRGSIAASVIFRHQKGEAKMCLGEEFLINPTPRMAAKVNAIFQGSSVNFVTRHTP